MKKNLTLFLLFGSLSLHLPAQTKQEKINELFEVMKLDTLQKAMIDNMSAMFRNNSFTVKDPQKDSIYRAYVMAETAAFTRKSSERTRVEVYDKYFTIGEVQKYIDFYKSPEGQKMLNLMPVLMKDMMAKMMKEDMPELQVKFKKKLEELYN